MAQGHFRLHARTDASTITIKWYGKYTETTTDADGTQRQMVRCVPLHENKGQAKSMLAEIVRKFRRKADMFPRSSAYLHHAAGEGWREAEGRAGAGTAQHDHLDNGSLRSRRPARHGDGAGAGARGRTGFWNRRGSAARDGNRWFYLHCYLHRNLAPGGKRSHVCRCHHPALTDQSIRRKWLK
jgi:hypothetical protein